MVPMAPNDGSSPSSSDESESGEGNIAVESDTGELGCCPSVADTAHETSSPTPYPSEIESEPVRMTFPLTDHVTVTTVESPFASKIL